MARTRAFTCLLILLLIVAAFNTAFMLKDSFFDSIEVLPKGEFLYSSLSPDGETTVSLYKVSVPEGSAIRGAVVTIDDSGEKIERNIFWELDADNVIVGWVSNNTVSINEHLINVTSDAVYDSRYDIEEPENLD